MTRKENRRCRPTPAPTTRRIRRCIPSSRAQKAPRQMEEVHTQLWSEGRTWGASGSVGPSSGSRASSQQASSTSSPCPASGRSAKRKQNPLNGMDKRLLSLKSPILHLLYGKSCGNPSIKTSSRRSTLWTEG